MPFSVVRRGLFATALANAAVRAGDYKTAATEAEASGDRFDGKKLTYPSSKAFQGIVGGVIARMEVAADGKVTDVELLAAVPAESFGESVVKTLRTWTFKPNKGVDTSTCRLNSRNRVYGVTFRML